MRRLAATREPPAMEGGVAVGVMATAVGGALGGSVLVTGGTGAVGSRLSIHLAHAYPGLVIVAARDEDRARRIAGRIGGEARGIRIDVHDARTLGPALDGIRLVVNCVPLREPFPLLRAAIERGLAYTDVTPAPIWETALSLAPLAERTGARVIVGAGLAPGASSVMARALAERLGGLQTLDVTLLFRLGDEFGDASLEYLLEAAGRTLVGIRDGAPHAFRPFSESRRVDLGAPFGARRAHRAPFTDQLWFARSLGVRSAATWLALEPRWSGWALGLIAKIGLIGALDRASRRAFAIRMLRAARRAAQIRGKDFALLVEARGTAGGGRLALSGSGEAEGTAAAASLVARALYAEQPIEAGVWFPEQVISPAWFLPALAALGVAVRDAEGTLS